MVQVADLLATQIPAPGQPDLRSFAWTMLWHASHRELASVAAPVQSQLAFSRDGSRLSVSGLVTGAADTTGAPAGIFGTGRTPARRTDPAASPGGNGRAAGRRYADRGASARRSGDPWRGRAPLAARRRRATERAAASGSLRGRGNQPARRRNRAFAPVAAGRSGQQRRAVVATRTAHAACRRASRLGTGTGVLSDGSELALVVDDAAQNDRPARVQIRALPSGSLRLERELDSSAAMSLVWSRDGQHLFVGDVRGELQRLAREDGRTVARLTAHDGMVLALAVSPDGRLLASGGMDRRVKLWRTADGRALGGLPLMRGAIEALEFAPDGRVLVATGGGELKLWDMASESGLGQGPGQARPVDGPKLVGLAFSPDSATVAAIGSGGGIGLYDVPWDAPTTSSRVAARRSWRTHAELLSRPAVCLRPPVTGGVRVWRTESGELLLDRELVVEDLVFAAETN